MHDLLVERGQFGFVEPGGRPAEMSEVETVDQRRQTGEGLDRLRGAEPRQQRSDRHRLQPDLAKMRDAQRPQPLRQLALAAGQQRFMREGGQRGAQRDEHLDLGCRVRDMILAAQHMRDAHIHIVNDRWQHVEPAAVGAANHRVRQQFGIETLLAADEVGPGDRLVMIQLEPPMGRAPFGLIGGDLVRCQRQRGAIIDRRQAATQQDLAPQLQFLLRFIGGIDMAGGLQRLELLLIQGEAIRLLFLRVPAQAKPLQVGADRRRIIGARPFQIGVVQPQQEAAATLARPQPVVQRGADIADVEMAGRRRGEARDDGHMCNPFVLRSH